MQGAIQVLCFFSLMGPCGVERLTEKWHHTCNEHNPRNRYLPIDYQLVIQWVTYLLVFPCYKTRPRTLNISVVDLLEKSRVTYQQPGLERNYHIFYWLLCGQFPEYAGALSIIETGDIQTNENLANGFPQETLLRSLQNSCRLWCCAHSEL